MTSLVCRACPSCIRRLGALDLKVGDWCPMHRAELQEQGTAPRCHHHLEPAGTGPKHRARNRSERRHPGTESG